MPLKRIVPFAWRTLRMYEISINSLHKVKSIVKLYSRYHFIIKNALRVSRLHNKLQEKTTLKLRKCNYIAQWQIFAPYILFNYYKLLLIIGVQIMRNCPLWNSKDIPNLKLFSKEIRKKLKIIQFLINNSLQANPI